MGSKTRVRKASTRVKPVKKNYGKRVGTKRSDRRWQSPDGELWDSRYEYIVYSKYKEAGYEIQRCDASDTLAFTLSIRSATCQTCGSAEVGQQRHWTPDFRLISKHEGDTAQCTYIETKGYMRPKERALYRAFCKENPDSGICFIFQQDYRTAKANPATGRKESRISDWFKQFAKGMKYAIWTGEIPIEFQSGESAKKSSKKVRQRKSRTQRGNV